MCNWIHILWKTMTGLSHRSGTPHIRWQSEGITWTSTRPFRCLEEWVKYIIIIIPLKWIRLYWQSLDRTADEQLLPSAPSRPHTITDATTPAINTFCDSTRKIDYSNFCIDPLRPSNEILPTRQKIYTALEWLRCWDGMGQVSEDISHHTRLLITTIIVFANWFWWMKWRLQSFAWQDLYACTSYPHVFLPVYYVWRHKAKVSI